jgi:teichuronic acid biosynthesis glycosyltransferase TuaG
MNPLVTAVIPAYDCEAYVAEAVASALAQTYRPLEVLVINDGSTDRTAEALRPFTGLVTLIDRENRGVYSSRNEGVERAAGEFVAFLDADDAWKPEKIARQMDVFARHPEVALVATRAEEIDAEGRPLARPPKESPGIYDRPASLYDELLNRGNPVSLSSVVARREALRRAGGFYDRERILSADYDLWIRVAAERPFYIMSEPLTRYRVLKNSLLHGSLEKEYGAQLGIIQRHRARFTSAGYRRRLAKLYLDWAESAFYQGDPQAWRRCRTSLALDPRNWRAWRLGAKNGVKIAFRALGLLAPIELA